MAGAAIRRGARAHGAGACVGGADDCEGGSDAVDHQAARGSWANSAEQLPGDERDLHADFQRIRTGAVWEAAVLSAFLCGGGSVGGESDREPDLVEVFSVWSGGVGVEVADVLEGAADAAGATRRKTGGSGCVRRLHGEERDNAETQSARSFAEWKTPGRSMWIMRCGERKAAGLKNPPLHKEGTGAPSFAQGK